MKVIAIIPARGGSKGIPKKNLTNIGHKPLIGWSIDAALESEFITNVIVSSDDEDILKTANNYGAQTHLRTASLATDTAKTEPVLVEVLRYLEAKNEKFDYLVLLQPTSPLRTASDIDAAFKMLIDKKATSLISVKEPESNPLKSFVLNEEGYMQGIVNNDFPFMPRQALPKVFYPNGAIYIVEVPYFNQAEKLFSDKTISYLMSADKSVDIDTKADILRAEKILKERI